MKLLNLITLGILAGIPLTGQAQDSCITKISVIVNNINEVNSELVKLFIDSYYYNDTLYCIENKRAKRKGVEYYD